MCLRVRRIPLVFTSSSVSASLTIVKFFAKSRASMPCSSFRGACSAMVLFSACSALREDMNKSHIQQDLGDVTAALDSQNSSFSSEMETKLPKVIQSYGWTRAEHKESAQLIVKECSSQKNVDKYNKRLAKCISEKANARLPVFESRYSTFVADHYFWDMDVFEYNHLYLQSGEKYIYIFNGRCV